MDNSPPNSPESSPPPSPHTSPLRISNHQRTRPRSRTLGDRVESTIQSSAALSASPPSSSRPLVPGSVRPLESERTPKQTVRRGASKKGLIVGPDLSVSRVKLTIAEVKRGILSLLDCTPEEILLQVISRLRFHIFTVCDPGGRNTSEAYHSVDFLLAVRQYRFSKDPHKRRELAAQMFQDYLAVDSEWEEGKIATCGLYHLAKRPDFRILTGTVANAINATSDCSSDLFLPIEQMVAQEFNKIYFDSTSPQYLFKETPSKILQVLFPPLMDLVESSKSSDLSGLQTICSDYFRTENDADALDTVSFVIDVRKWRENFRQLADKGSDIVPSAVKLCSQLLPSSGERFCEPKRFIIGQRGQSALVRLLRSLGYHRSQLKEVLVKFKMVSNPEEAAQTLLKYGIRKESKTISPRADSNEVIRKQVIELQAAACEELDRRYFSERIWSTPRFSTQLRAYLNYSSLPNGEQVTDDQIESVDRIVQAACSRLSVGTTERMICSKLTNHNDSVLHRIAQLIKTTVWLVDGSNKPGNQFWNNKAKQIVSEAIRWHPLFLLGLTARFEEARCELANGHRKMGDHWSIFSKQTAIDLERITYEGSGRNLSLETIIELIKPNSSKKEIVELVIHGDRRDALYKIVIQYDTFVTAARQKLIDSLKELQQRAEQIKCAVRQTKALKLIQSMQLPSQQFSSLWTTSTHPVDRETLKNVLVFTTVKQLKDTLFAELNRPRLTVKCASKAVIDVPMSSTIDDTLLRLMDHLKKEGSPWSNIDPAPFVEKIVQSKPDRAVVTISQAPCVAILAALNQSFLETCLKVASRHCDTLFDNRELGLRATAETSQSKSIEFSVIAHLQQTTITYSQLFTASVSGVAPNKPIRIATFNHQLAITFNCDGQPIRMEHRVSDPKPIDRAF